MIRVKQAIQTAGVIIDGHFVFADGGHATIKLEMDNLWHHSKELAVVLDALAEAKDLPPADLIIGVPTGGQRIALELVASKRLSIPIAVLERVPGGAKQDFRFASEADKRLADRAKSIRIYEDVVTTLSSVAGVVKLLDSSKQSIHSLAIWRRGQVKLEYSRGVTDHYLIEETIPVFTPKGCPHCNI